MSADNPPIVAANQIGASKSNAAVEVTVIKSVPASELAVAVDTVSIDATVPNGTLTPSEAYVTLPVPAPAPVATNTSPKLPYAAPAAIHCAEVVPTAVLIT